MMRLKSLGWRMLAVALAILCEPALSACTSCFGQSDSNMAKGMNMGIFALLLVIGSVLCGVVCFFVYLAKRSAALEHPQVPHSFSPNQNNA
jgi:hypothetical protein